MSINLSLNIRLSVMSLAACFALTACGGYGQIRNDELERLRYEKGYSLTKASKREKAYNDVHLTLSLSGGGTRAAAFSYGVMQALSNTRSSKRSVNFSMLDEVDAISSVSGGSFTAAYYGLYGDKMFDDYEKAFLRRNVQGGLLRSILNPFEWFNGDGRTEEAIKLYDKHVFKGATYADLEKADGPLILINATDIANEVRFSFVQEYFDLLCSDLSSYSVARAVTASSAVPLVFNPLVLKNYSGCTKGVPKWLREARERAIGDPELSLTIDNLIHYYDKDARPFAHFVDGGITDNLGLRAMYDFVEIAGGAKGFLEVVGNKTPKRIVVISVDSSASTPSTMGRTLKRPSVGNTINTISRIQLHRYNVATKKLTHRVLQEWAADLSTDEETVDYYFIDLNFGQLVNPELIEYLNNVPTSFNLTNKQVTRLIDAGRQLVLEHPEFKRLQRDISAD